MTLGTNLAAAALGVALLATTTACGGATGAAGKPAAGPAASDSAPHVKADPAAIKLLPADLQKGGTITMVADLHYPPTSFLAKDNKTPIGYNVEIAKLLGEELGLKVEIKNVPWDNVIPGLASGRYDLTATNMSPQPERLEVLDMVTYWEAGSSLIVQKGNPEDLSLADQSTCGKKVAVMTGSSQQQDYLPQLSAACEAAGEKPVDGVVLANVEGALTQLVAHRVDGVFSDTSQLAWAAKQQPQAFELVSPQFKKQEGNDIVALGLPKNSPLTEAIHAAMQSLIDSPAYKETLDRWGLGAGAISKSEILR
jgi:polar amino acid transport system substrate-binding protein